MYVIIEVRNQGTGFQQEIFKDKVYAKMELTVLVKSTGYEEKISQKKTEQSNLLISHFMKFIYLKKHEMKTQ